MRRPLYGWLLADAISLTGTRLSMLALPWFVLVTTGSPTKTGLVALCEMAPLVALKVLGGPVIDRLGPRRVSISCDLGSTVVVAAVPILYAAGLLSLPLLLVLVALGGALRGPGDAAKAALTPLLVDAAGVPVERATGLSSMVERSATMLGAACAGILIGTIGAPAAIGVDAASFAVCAGVLAWATAGLPRPALEEQDPVPYLVRLREGWDFLRHDRILVAIAVMVTLTNLIDLAFASVLVPVWGHAHAGAAEVGAIFAVFSGASAIGSALAARWAAGLPRYATYLTAFLVTGLPRFLVLALGVPLAGVLAVFVVGGFASGFLNPVLGAVEIERIPGRLLGRVSSLMTAACYALMPLGGLLGGGLVSAVGLSAALLICGAAYFVVTMLPAADPTWRELDRRGPAPTEVPAAPAA
jgi:MFS family permease